MASTIFHAVVEVKTFESGPIFFVSIHVGSKAATLSKIGTLAMSEDDYLRWKLLMLGGTEKYGHQLDTAFTVEEHDPRPLEEITETVRALLSKGGDAEKP